MQIYKNNVLIHFFSELFIMIHVISHPRHRCSRWSLARPASALWRLLPLVANSSGVASLVSVFCILYSVFCIRCSVFGGLMACLSNKYIWGELNVTKQPTPGNQSVLLNTEYRPATKLTAPNRGPARSDGASS
jgi:hypothetical protein